MASAHQDITFGDTAGLVYIDVPEGQPSSATAKVFRWDATDDGDSEWSVTTSIDSVDTTFDANSGASSANPKLLNLASTTGINVGQEYIATAATGAKESVLITGVTSGASATALLGLGLDYVSGNTFQGSRISATVDATWIADKGNINIGNTTFDRWRVRWVYVVSSTTYVRTSTFSVVRRAGTHTVTPNDVALRYPSLVNIAPHNFQHERMQILIDRSYQEFATDLIGVDIPDEQVLSPKIVNEMTTLKFAVVVTQDKAMAGGDSLPMEIAERIYNQKFQSIFAAPSVVKVPVSTSNSGAGDVRAPILLSRR